MSKMQYGLVFVLNALQSNMLKVQRFQNWALHICTLSTRYTSNISLHTACRVLPVKLRCKLDLLILMYKRLCRGHKIVVPVRDTRMSSAPLLAITGHYWPNSGKYLKCISYLGPHLWNNLPTRVRLLRGLNQFKCAAREEIGIEFNALTRV